MSRTILIVEDDANNRALMSAILRGLHYQTLEAANGRLAVEEAHRHHPDLILMDMSMPIVNGFEATRQLKSNPSTAAIPIIAVTAYDTRKDMTEALAAGCAGFLAKPIDIVALRQTVEGVLTAQTPIP